ncbi:MAG: phage protein GemA/Gp16 family protein [Bacteroidota bacterium]|jgi:hypothetical protein
MNRQSNFSPLPRGRARGGRNFLIQRIHVLKRDLSLDDETYRTILRSISGKESCADIDDEYLNLIKQQLESVQQRRQLGSSLKLKNENEHRKIAKLGFLLGWSWHDIAGFCFKQTGKRSTHTCDNLGLRKIISGMTNIINDKLADGSLKLAHKDLEIFLRHTQQSDT